ncbi:MAG: NAD(P)-dependent oxidoreductase [Aggregatilineales bacterium]
MTLRGQNVLVTGATGFLGGVITRQLTAYGAKVKALARRPDRDAFIRDLPNVEIVTGDITDAASMQSVMQGVDIVIHSAAALDGNIHDQRKINRDGTRNVMQAAADAGVKRVVHISTISVYGYGVSGDVTEQTPPAPGHDPYPITKLEAEQVVQEIGSARDLPYTIIRPGMIYGSNSSMWTKTMFKIARRKPTIFIGDGSGSAFPIFVEDVADMVIKLATHENALGEIFNCTPDPSPTWREFLGAYSQLAGHQSWLGVPPILLMPIVYMIALFSPKYSMMKDLPAMLGFLQRRIHYRTDKAINILGWKPQYDLQRGIESCVPYLREKGLLS